MAQSFFRSESCWGSTPFAFCGLSFATEENALASPSWGFCVLSSFLLISVLLLLCAVLAVPCDVTGVVPGGSPVGCAGAVPITTAEGSAALLGALLVCVSES